MGKESAYNAEYIRDVGSVPGLGTSPGIGNGNPSQYSCLENSMGRRVWWATVHGVTEWDMTEHLAPSPPLNASRDRGITTLHFIEVISML